MKGLKRKFEVYSISIGEAREHFLKPKLRSAILNTNGELTTVLNFQQPQATVSRLYQAAQLLFPGFDDSLTAKLREELAVFLPVFTWVNLSLQRYDIRSSV